jgi:hypothetical protein
MANKYEIVRYYSPNEDCFFLRLTKDGKYLNTYSDTEEGLKRAKEHCNTLAHNPVPKETVIYSITDKTKED